MAFALDHTCVVEYQGITRRAENSFVVMKFGGGSAIVNAHVGKRGASHDEFLAQLPDTEPRFAVYDFAWEGGAKHMLLFIFWNPDSAPFRLRRDAAVAKPIVQQNLDDARIEIAATSKDELSYDNILRRVAK